MQMLLRTAARLLVSLLAGLAGTAHASLVSYADNRAGFIAAASPTTVPFVADPPGAPLSGAPRTIGNAVANVTFTSQSFDDGCSTSPCAIIFGNFNSRVPAVQFGESGQEDFSMGFSKPVFDFGIDVYEPSFNRVTGNIGCNTRVCVDTLFRFTFYSGSTVLGSIDYNAPDDDGSAATAPLGFLGVMSSTGITRVVVNDLSGAADNEYFANLRIGTTLPGTTGVPEPGSAALALAALAGMWACQAYRRRR